MRSSTVILLIVIALMCGWIVRQNREIDKRDKLIEALINLNGAKTELIQFYECLFKAIEDGVKEGTTQGSQRKLQV